MAEFKAFIREHGKKKGITEFSLLLDESHKIEAKVTSLPIENGSVIADHTVKDQDKPSLTLICSDTTGEKSKKAWAKLSSYAGSGKFLDIYTELEIYEKVLLTSASVKLDVSSGLTLIVQVEFVKPVIVKRGFTNAKFGKKKLGTKDGKNLSGKNSTDGEKRQQSVLKSILGKVFK